MTLPAAYFDRLYARSPDPWSLRTRWYEKRKRAVTVAALPRERYARAFEPGCSVGSLTAALATRCQELVAADAHDGAAAAAQAALAGHPHVAVRRMAVPDEWPYGSFDLVVLSELGYYFEPPDLRRLVGRAIESLDPGGTLVACHWRHPVHEYPATGDDVHRLLQAQPEMAVAAHHLEEDFVLDVWTRGPVPVGRAR